MSNLETYRQQFSTKHPEAGEFNQGAVVNAEQAKKLGEVFSGKVLELSRKAELSTADMAFLDNVVDIGTRNIVVNPGAQLPVESEHVRELVKASAHLYRESAQTWPLDHDVSSSQDIHTVMNGLTGNAVGVRGNPALRTPIEDYAMHIVPYFGEVVAQNGDLQLDAYMTGNLQYMLAQYEMVEQQPVQA